ncbi:MAG TPA: sugar ABC transporter substrate-binding protein [Arsenicitalea sp.]|jgi:multiple sugar transport system substrate-binding protein|nr:sugar ABC transporter substrate-binding protein [Arsenicitalea sp.]
MRRRSVLASLAIALMAGVFSPIAAMAQDREVVTFAAPLFSGDRGPSFRAWVEKFNASQDKIQVVPATVPFSSFANTIFTQIAGGGGPDIIRWELNDFYPAVDAGMMMSLDDVISDADYKFINADSLMKIDGKRYGVIFTAAPYQMIYNKALIATPPKTFDELLSMAKAATTGDVFGYAFRTTAAESAGFWQDLCDFVFGFGGRWADGKGNLTVNSPDVVKGVAAYKKVYDAGIIPKGADAATYRRMFMQGKVAMMVDNAGVVGSISTAAPNINYGAAPSPFPDPHQGAILATLAINAKTPHKQAAVTFMKWILGQGQLGLLGLPGIVGGGVVVQRPPLGPNAPKGLEEALNVYNASMENGLPQLVPGFEVQTPQMQEIILNKVIAVLQNNVDPQKAMDDAQAEIEKRVLHK